MRKKLCSFLTKCGTRQAVEQLSVSIALLVNARISRAKMLNVLSGLSKKNFLSIMSDFYLKIYEFSTVEFH